MNGIEANVRAAEAAQDCWEFIEAEWPDVPARFYERLIELCKSKAPQPAVAASEVKELPDNWQRLNVFPRGQYENEAVADVPLWYIDNWLDNSRDRFTNELRQWRKSRAGREREQRDE
jgi:hypothetical protein